jgi:hypothetical protein
MSGRKLCRCLPNGTHAPMLARVSTRFRAAAWREHYTQGMQAITPRNERPSLISTRGGDGTSGRAFVTVELDITIKNSRPTQVGFSHTYVWRICQNWTEQLFGLIGDRTSQESRSIFERCSSALLAIGFDHPTHNSCQGGGSLIQFHTRSPSARAACANRRSAVISIGFASGNLEK